MFHNLVESTSNARANARQSAYFGITALINAALLLTVFVWSVFSFDLTTLASGDDFSLNTIVAPVAPPESKPPVIPDTKPIQKSVSDDEQKPDLIKDPIENINNPSTPPDKYTAPGTPVRERIPYIVSNINRIGTISGDDNPVRESSPNSTPAIAVKTEKIDEDKEMTAPPAPKPAPVVKKDVTVSKGVVNGEAKNLPKPAYPPSAKVARISGAVNVQVLIDVDGRVISATAVSGHTLLRAAAVQAAKQAKFSPTTLSNQPVKVTGVIVYNFVP